MLASTEHDQTTVQLDRIFRLQRQAFRQDPNPPLAARQANLDSLQRLLTDHIDQLCDAVSADYGCRSPRETKLLELFPALEAVKHARSHLAEWMHSERKSVSLWFQFGHAAVIKQPLGVVGIIAPWNYPIFLSMVPLVSVLAAGNRAIIRISGSTPQTTALLSQLIAEHFHEDQVAIVEGSVEVSRALVSLPLDHLLFTGSNKTGHEVLRAAAEHLTPVTLELGGKSPAIISPAYPLKSATERILWGKCLNAGQTCVAPDYVLLPESQINAFVEAARSAAQHFYPEGALSPDYTSLINEHHYQRLSELLDDARTKGATAIPLLAGQSAANRKFAPNLLLNVHDDMHVMQEEIFGPLLPIVPYSHFEDALDYVKDRAAPLALYYFDHDNSRTDRVLHETTAGGVTINDTILHVAQNELPFGGVGASGMGEYHGEAGFNRFSKQKGVFHQSRVNGMSLFNPPFGRLFDALITRVMR